MGGRGGAAAGAATRAAAATAVVVGLDNGIANLLLGILSDGVNTVEREASASATREWNLQLERWGALG